MTNPFNMEFALDCCTTLNVLNVSYLLNILFSLVLVLHIYTESVHETK
jgi:hypothetical protein